MWSDNDAGRFPYPYLVITHGSVRSGKEIFVGREFEIERLKKDLRDDWRKYIEQINDRAPFLALDYSYFGLLADEGASVGGTLYSKGGVVREFHAPLKNWAKKLGVLLQTD